MTTSMREERYKPGLLKLLPTFLYIGLATITRLLESPFRGSHGAPTLRQDVAYATVREIMNRVSVLDSQGLTATTESVYRKEARQLKWNPNTIEIGEGVRGHWLGDDNAKYVLIYFHGGGYIGYATPGHLKYQFALQKAARNAGHDFSIFSVSYTLSPHKTYPHQLLQAALALEYLLQTQKRDPSTLLVGGDSAGANLASALLLHIAKPHPSVAKIKLPTKLRGALLISPWISFETKSPAFKDNALSDYITVEALNRASSAFIGVGEADEYAEPIRASSDWWKQVATTAVDEIMVWGGGGEILIDSIRIYANTIAVGFANADIAVPHHSARDKEMDGVGSSRQRLGRERVYFVEIPRAAHEEQIMNLTLRIKGNQPAATVIEEWLNARLA